MTPQQFRLLATRENKTLTMKTKNLSLHVLLTVVLNKVTEYKNTYALKKLLCLFQFYLHLLLSKLQIPNLLSLCFDLISQHANLQDQRFFFVF